MELTETNETVCINNKMKLYYVCVPAALLFSDLQQQIIRADVAHMLD